MSRIIKQVQVSHAPVIVNSLRLAVSVEEKPFSDDRQPNIAQQIILQAEEEAAAIIANAKREMNEKSAQLYKESQEQGLSAGYTDGKEQGYAAGVAAGEIAAKRQMETDIRDAIAEAARIMNIADQQVQQTILSAQTQITDIALAIAEKILNCEIDVNSQVVVSVVKAALDKVRNQERIAIRVNPQDFACVIAAKGEFEAILQREQSIEIVADQTVSRGGCVIDSVFGSADARIETQLQAIRATIRCLLP